MQAARARFIGGCRGKPDFVLSSGLADDFWREWLLDRLTVGQTYVIDLRSVAQRHHPLHRVVFEIDAGVVVAGIAGFHFSGADQLQVERPTVRLRIVVRAVAPLDESEALHRRQFLWPRISRPFLEPAE